MIAFISRPGDHSFVGIYRLVTKTVDFIETSMDNDTYPAWSPDGSQLAYIRIPNMNNLIPFVPVREGNPWSIRLYDIGTGKAKELWKASAAVAVLFLVIFRRKRIYCGGSKDGKLLFPYEKDGWQHLYELDINSGKIKLVTPGNGEIENVTASVDRRTVYYTTNIR
jgi:Tol biopolymer transport system component